MTYKVTGKGSYKYTCPLCGVVYLRAQMKQRWDGLLVCPKDWEARHPMDFYRTKVDTLQLDATARDLTNSDTVDASNPNAVGWTPSWSFTVTGTAPTTPNGNSKVDRTGASVTRSLLANVQIPQGTVVLLDSGLQLTLPESPTVAGTYTLTANGQLVKSGAIPISSATLVIGGAGEIRRIVGSPNMVMTFSGRYGIV